MNTKIIKNLFKGYGVGNTVEVTTDSIQYSGKTFNVGDIVTTYYKGIFKIVGFKGGNVYFYKIADTRYNIKIGKQIEYCSLDYCLPSLQDIKGKISDEIEKASKMLQYLEENATSASLY